MLKCLNQCIIIYLYSYKIDETTATIFYSIPFYLSAILSPIVGHFIDKYGYNIELILLASIS